VRLVPAQGRAGHGLGGVAGAGRPHHRRCRGVNDHTLAALIRGSQLKLYPDAGHAFLFQDWSSFAALVNSFR
jgi:hypothetical protein